MAFVNRLISSHAVGTLATNPAVFSDLINVGQWPSHPNAITKITKIEIWYNVNRINGIKPTYSIAGGTTQSVLHGSAVGEHQQFELTANERISGTFGAVNVSDGALRRLGFVVYNNANGQISTKGPFPSPPNPDPGVKGFTFLGHITGFGGSLSADNLLDAIVFYKSPDSQPLSG